MDSQHVETLVDAYALGALEPDEVDVVERHVEHCASCRALADAARANAELLLYAVPQVAPPPALRSRVLARIAQEKSAAGQTNHEPQAAAASEPVVPRRIDESDVGRSRWRRFFEVLLNEPAQTSRTGDLLRDLLADPQVAIWPIAGTGDAPGASGRLIISPRSREAVVVANGLRRPELGKAYQVWLLHGGQPQPNALFAVDRSGIGATIVRAPGPWRDFDTVAVTPEPRSGSPAPTGPILLAGSLAAAE